MILVTVRCWGQIVEHNLTADKSEVYGGIKMDCLRCKEEMIKAKLKGDAVGTVVYLTNKKNGIFENEKNSTVSCYVCPKCGYVELNADNAKNLI